MKTLIKNGYFITLNENQDRFINGNMIIVDDKITYIGEALKDHTESFDQVIDVNGNIIMPGLINTHSHAAMSLLRGYGDDLPLQEWLEKKMWPIEAQFKEDHVHWGTKLAIVEMLKTGTTTFLDMYSQMDTVAKVVEESGIRASLSRGVIGLVSREEQRKKLDEAVKFSKDWMNAVDGRITTMMAPHAPYTCPPDYIKEIIDASSELSIPIHIHLSETELEVKQNIETYGTRPVEHLYKLGLFNRPTIVAHAVHINDEEIEILKVNNVKVSHNPGSNLKLGSGIAPVQKMLYEGLHVSLGTDSAASNNNLDLFEEIRLAALIHKGYKQDPLAIPAEAAIRMGTIYGAEALFLDHAIGSLEVGKKADFISINTHQVHFHPLYDPISHLVYSASGKDVQDVFIDGRQIVKEGKILTLDEEQIIFEVNRLSKQWI